nr:MarR family transcriptional regulator [Tomitella gaofuii]
MEHTERQDAETAGAGAGEPRWLDAEELEAWVQVAMLMMHLPGELDAQLLRDSHLTHFEYEVLSRLSEAQERSLRMSTLATLAGGSLSRLSHVVKRLQDRGWVERHPCPEDRRVTFACLTDAGYDVVVQAAPGYVENVRRLVVDKLTRAQLGELIGIGRRLNDTIERIV